MLGMKCPTVSRSTACIRRASRQVGPGRDSPRRYSGAPSLTKGSGTTSVNPPVRLCNSMTRCQCVTHADGESTCPNMIVAVLNRPTS